MARTLSVAAKRKRKQLFDAEKAKKAAKPATINLAGAIGGGVVGAVAPPYISGPGGVILIFAGAYTGKEWLTSVGTGMLVSTTCTVATNPNLRTSPDGKIDTETEIHNGKERAKTFFSSLWEKFNFFKKKEESPSDTELGNPYLVLDSLESQVLASSMDYARNRLPSPDMMDIEMAASQEINGFMHM